jgi:hypothetical protein
MYAPWLKYGVIVENQEEKALHYIIPQLDNVLIGAIHQGMTVQDENAENGDEFKYLMESAVSLVPNLKASRIIRFHIDQKM